MDLRVESHGFILEFIRCFRANPCLWNYDTDDYRNKNMKKEAYNKLLEINRKYDRSTTMEYVKKKIQSLRASHRKEVKKVEVRSKNGKLYVPKLWYFKELNFLTEQLKAGGNRIRITQSNGNDSKVSDADTLSSEPPPYLKPTPVAAALSTQSPPSSKPTSNSSSKNTHKRSVEKEKVSELPSKVPKPTEDEFDLIGRSIACKLRNMTSDQKIFAEKIINDALFYGQLKKLQVESKITTTNSVAISMDVLYPSSNPRRSRNNYSCGGTSSDQELIKIEE